MAVNNPLRNAIRNAMFAPIGGKFGGSSVSPVSPVAAYALSDGTLPLYVNDPVNDVYFAKDKMRTFDDINQHTLTTLATQFDENGNMVWGPHNLASYSDDLTNAVTSTSNATVIDSSTIEYTATGWAVYAGGIAVNAGETFTIEIEVSAADASSEGVIVTYTVGIDGANNWVSGGFSVTVEPRTASITQTVGSGGTKISQVRLNTNGAATLNVEKIRIYRSDLGGMANNPDTGNSYVPTTTSAVYMHRRTNHIYDGSEWVRSPLTEREARTNVIEYSNDISTGAWNNSGGLRLSGIFATNPLTETVNKFQVGAANNNIRFYKQVNRTPSSPQTTWHFFAKADGIDWIKTRVSIAGDFVGVFFDLTNGVIGSSDIGFTGFMQPLGNGWYHCITVGPSVTDQYAGVSLAAGDGDVDLSTYSGAVTNGVLFTAFQWEDAPTPSSHIPNADSTFTRAADSALVTPAALAPYDAAGFSIVQKGVMTYADEEIAVQSRPFRWIQNGNNFVAINLDTSGSNEFDLLQRKNGVVNQINSGLGFSEVGVNAQFSLATRNTPNNQNIAINGAAALEDTFTAQLPDLSAADIEIAEVIMGSIRSTVIYPPLTDSQLEFASAPPPFGNAKLLYVDNTTPSFSVPTFTGNPEGSGIGAMVAYGDKLYCSPWSAQNPESPTVLIIDTVARTISRTNYGLNLAAVFPPPDQGGQFGGGCLGDDGKIYFAPWAENSMLIIDPEAETAILEDFGGIMGVWTSDVVTGVHAHSYGMVNGGNGKLYTIPYGMKDRHPIIINTRTGTAEVAPYDQIATTKTGYFSDVELWNGGALALNGKIYCSPYNSGAKGSEQVLVIDTADDSGIVTDFGLTMETGGYLYGKPTLGIDGKIYMPPYRATKALVIDPSNDTAVFEDWGLTFPENSFDYYNSLLGPDGKVYFYGKFTDQWCVVDTEAGTASFETLGPVPQANFAAMMPDGKIWLPGQNPPEGVNSTGNPAVITVTPNRTQELNYFEELVYSRWVNNS